MSTRVSRLASMAGSLLAAGLVAGCGLKGPLSLPEKPGDVTIRPGPTGKAPEAAQAPAGQEAPAGQAVPAGQEAPTGTHAPVAAPEDTLPPLPPSESDVTGG
jgi:predicted small lipoprotein YifL